MLPVPQVREKLDLKGLKYATPDEGLSAVRA